MRTSMISCKTLKHYNNNAKAYITDTVNAESERSAEQIFTMVLQLSVNP